MRLQPLTRARLAGLGEVGAAWVEELPRTLAALAEQWGLEIDRPLPGGSASYVVAAGRGPERLVLKVPVPGVDTTREAAVLRAAGGRGYALLHGYDAATGALLLERLDGQLEQWPRPPEEKLAVLAETLREAWTVTIGGVDDTDRAEELADLVTRLAPEQDEQADAHPLDPAVLRRALDHAESLAGWSGPVVTVHGDPHPANVLRARRDGDTPWVLVDPDGMRADPAYDAGIALRDWCSHLRGPDARDRLRTWTRDLAERLGLDAERVWAWAYLERVSTGLYVTSIGSPRVAAPYLETARALL